MSRWNAKKTGKGSITIFFTKQSSKKKGELYNIRFLIYAN